MTTLKRPNTKHSIEVRHYLPGQTHYGNTRTGKFTGDYGRFEIVGTVMRKLKTEQIGNFAPVFCTYNGNSRVLVHSDLGDLSDPFRANESYADKLFIVVPAAGTSDGLNR